MTNYDKIYSMIDYNTNSTLKKVVDNFTGHTKGIRTSEM